MADYRISRKEQARFEANFENQREAFALLALIDAEFRSDPTSVQCFDLRIVDRVRRCVAARAEYEKDDPFHEVSHG